VLLLEHLNVLLDAAIEDVHHVLQRLETECGAVIVSVVC
jgi:hypothetical protein